MTKMTNHLPGGPPAKLFACTFCYRDAFESVGFIDNKNAQKCAIAHLTLRSGARYGREGGDPILPCSLRRRQTVAGAVPWWLLLLSSACLRCPRSSRPVLLRRTVLKPQLLLFVTCMGEANALRKSKWKGELLLVKAHSCESSIGTVAGERSEEVQLVQVEAVLVVGVSTACSAVVIP